MSSDLPIQNDLKSTTRTETLSSGEPETATSQDLGISTPNDSTWQAQLSAARAEIAEKVQKQQMQDGWGTVDSVEEHDKDVDEPMMSSIIRERRASAVTEDGEEDQFIAELLRPGSRTKEEDTSDSQTTNSSETPKDAAEGTTPDSHEAEENVDEKMCRICFDSEEQELGKLFRPCKCKGSSQYVHTECLTAWRKASQNTSNAFRCGTCSYEYRFQRTLVGNIINSRFSVLTLTVITFLLLTWIAGFLANSLLSVVESRSRAWNGTPFDDFFVQDHILLGEGVRESLSFVTHQLEESRWSTARKIAHQAQLQEQAKLNVDAGFLARVALHFTKGTALLGLLSVFYTYIAATFVSPLGRTLFRAIRPAAGRRRNGDNSASMGQIIIIIVIVIGIARAIRQVYRGVRWVSRRFLSRLEDLVLEVN